MNILVTGGAGYIGSHTCVELLNNNHTVIVADNLCNSKAETIDKIKQITNKDLTFYQIDVTNEVVVESIFANHKIDGIIHFAGLKAVGESVEKPLEYYYNNLLSTMVLSKMCKKYNVNKFVFSSSATVYGDNQVPFVETMVTLKAPTLRGQTPAKKENNCRIYLHKRHGEIGTMAINITRMFGRSLRGWHINNCYMIVNLGGLRYLKARARSLVNFFVSINCTRILGSGNEKKFYRKLANLRNI